MYGILIDCMLYSSNLGKESIEIDFEELNCQGLACVKATNSTDYSSYLGNNKRRCIG